MPGNINHWVNHDASLISRDVFTSEEIYKLEKQKIFRQCWLFLCHESQLKHSADFMTTYMGETPVIVSRGSDGNIHACVNSCTHRGLPVCRSDSGNTKRFICPYHNWSYTVEGNLAAVPQERHLCQAPDKNTLGLKKVPRLASYRGLWFGSFNPDIESLDDYLGDMKFYLDTFFNRFPAGIEVVGEPHKWLINANWKLPVENQMGDVAHGPYLHATLLNAQNPAIPEIDQYGFNCVAKPGHGAALRLMPETTDPATIAWGLEGPAAFLGPPDTMDYLLSIQASAAERIGPIGARIKGLTYGVFPNFNFLWSNSVIRVSHPRGPNQVEYWSWWMVPSDAPDHIKQALRSNYNTLFGPGGMLEQEDSEAWMQQYKGSNIDYMEDKPLYYGLGLGEEQSDHPELPGMIGSAYNEHYARQYYIRWREQLLMDN